MNLRRWTAWMPGCETPSDWLVWTQGESDMPNEKGEPVSPHVREIPPLLRRRAGHLGRAALMTLTRPELPYDGQPIILCSRLGEFSRSLEIQRDLARNSMVSPQQFSMAVHNATGGLFMMAQKAQAPLTAISAQEETALAGLQEAQGQLAEGGEALWLCFGDEPLPVEYRNLSASPCAHLDYFAFVLELLPGDDFHLFPDPEAAFPLAAARPAASPLDVLRFFLRPEDEDLRLSSRGGWTLRRQFPSNPEVEALPA
jgi:hypothetical protein